MNGYGTVYAIQHLETGKRYVGSTRNLAARIGHHVSSLHNGQHSIEDFQEDFNKNPGISVSILWQGVASSEALRNMERLYMDKFNSRDREHGYNYKDPSKEVKVWPSETIGPKRITKSLKKLEQKVPKTFQNILDIEDHPGWAIGLTDSEIEVIQNLSKLPVDLQQQFLNMIAGAAMAIEFFSQR